MEIYSKHIGTEPFKKTIIKMKKNKYMISKKYLIKRYTEEEKSAYKIAQEIGCERSVIYRRLREYNIKIRKGGIRKDQYVGEDNFNYKQGNTLKKHYCIICKINQISLCNFYYGSRRCNKCRDMETIKKKLSKSHKGIKLTKKWKENISKALKNKPKTIKHRENISKGLKGKISPNLGKKLTKNHKMKISKAHKGKRSSTATRRKISLTLGGTGIPHENNNYPDEFFRARYWILKRDNHTCQKCGIIEENYYRGLDVHHIDYNRINNDKNNLICLCHRCNVRANKNRDYWFAYFTYLIKEIK